MLAEESERKHFTCASIRARVRGVVKYEGNIPLQLRTSARRDIFGVKRSVEKHACVGRGDIKVMIVAHTHMERNNKLLLYDARKFVSTGLRALAHYFWSG